jgi:hypothetical protein
LGKKDVKGREKLTPGKEEREVIWIRANNTAHFYPKGARHMSFG